MPQDEVSCEERNLRNKLHGPDFISEQEMAEGMLVGPVQPERYLSKWEAQKEVNQELFENGAENSIEKTINLGGSVHYLLPNCGKLLGRGFRWLRWCTLASRIRN